MPLKALFLVYLLIDLFNLFNKLIKSNLPLFVVGNYYDFTPMMEMKPSEPCMDVNLMYYTAKYECHIMYNYMMTQQSVTCL